MKDRNKDAISIIEGACNPIAVAGALHDHSLKMLRDKVGMTEIRKDPALRLMAYQLAHLYDVLDMSVKELDRLLINNEMGES